MPYKSKSQMITLRLQDRNDGLPSFEPEYFDVVAQGGCALQDALYESGKRHFSAGHFERALVDFSLVLRQLERLERRAARSEERRPSFDAEATGFRNLDEYLDQCVAGIQRRKRRATATVLDQRALLAGGVDPANPTFWNRLHAGCLHCLTSVVEVTDLLGKVKRDLAPIPAPPTAAPSTYAAPRSPARSRRKSEA